MSKPVIIKREIENNLEYVIRLLINLILCSQCLRITFCQARNSIYFGQSPVKAQAMCFDAVNIQSKRKGEAFHRVFYPRCFYRRHYYLRYFYLRYFCRLPEWCRRWKEAAWVELEAVW